jgi:hypothetical protein
MLKQPFIWTAEDQKAFETLRDRLITPPVLAYPNFDEKFLLFTDACDYEIGAVLSQIQNGEEQKKDSLRKPTATERVSILVL